MKKITKEKILAKIKSKNILLFLILAFLLIIVFISLTERSLNEKPQKGGSVTEIIIGKNPRNINPVLATSKTDTDILPLIYSSLLKNNHKGDVVANIADFKISEDNKIYTITIKDNVKFSNNDILTSDDIIFTIKKIQDPLIKSPYFSEWINIETKKIDDKNLQIILPKQYDQFKNTLTKLYILPKKLWQDISPSEFPFFELNNHPIGSGPFKIEKTIRDDKFGKIEKYILVKNPYYFLEDKVFLDQFNIVFFDNLEKYKKSILYTNKKILKNIFSVPADQITTIANTTTYNNYKIINFDSTRIFGLFLNTKKEFLSSSSIRQAISDSINRDIISEDILLNFANKISSPIYLNSSIKKDKITKKDIINKLEKAGYIINKSSLLINKKTKKPVEINLAILKSKEFESIAREIKENLSSIGIITNIVKYTNSDLINNIIRPREFDMTLYGYQTSIIPDYYFLFHSSQNEDPQINISNTNNKKIDKILLELRKVIPQAEKIKKYKEIENIIKQENKFIPLYSPNYIYITDKRLKGIERKTIDNQQLRFSDVQNWYVKTSNMIPFLK